MSFKLLTLQLVLFCCFGQLLAQKAKNQNYHENLLVNPDAVDGGTVIGWEQEKGKWFGHQGNPRDSDDNYFTSRGPNADRSQLINLTNFFSEEVLDKAPPIVISEVYERVTCGAQYNLELELLDAKKQVIGTWQSQNKGFKNIDCSIDGYQELLSKRITNYGFGLRYIRWIDKIRGKGTGESIRLKKAYLGISPPNLLEVPEKESSWNWKGTNIKGTKRLIKEEVLTSPEEIITFPRGTEDKKILTVEAGDWVVRNQKIDLKLNGYLDSDLKNSPAIIFSSSYGRLNCGDEYYLKVVLLDDKNQVLNSFYSGIQKREFNCNSNDNYQELITNFLNTPKGKTVTYIEIEQGLKNIEADSNIEKKAFFSDSYVGLIDINNQQNQRVKRDLALNANYTSALATVSAGTISCLYLSSITGGISAPICTGLGVAGGLIYVYNYLTDFSVQPIASEKMENNPSDNGSAKTGIDNIAKHLKSNGFNLWDISNNDKIEVFATPSFSNEHFQLTFSSYTDKLYKNLKKVKKIIDITTLSKIDGDYIKGLHNVLAQIQKSAKKTDDEIIVRIFLGLSGFSNGSYSDGVFTALKRIFERLGQGHRIEGLPQSRGNEVVNEILGKITEGLPKGGNGNLKVYMTASRTFGKGLLGEGILSWNHAKIVAIDGKTLFSGGNNLWGIYLGDTPPMDAATIINGDAALYAHKFADILWNEHLEKVKTKEETHIREWNDSAADLITVKEVPLAKSILNFTSSPKTSNKGLKVLSVGQLNAKAENKNDKLTNLPTSTLKEAIKYILDHAKNSIYISQQAIAHGFINKFVNHVDKAIIRILIKKALSGIPVKIILSNKQAGHDTTSHISNTELINIIWQVAKEMGIDDNLANRKLLCENIDLGYIRVDEVTETYPNTKESFANHAKTIMVDQSVFLIGSHNLYAQYPAQLAEFSTIIEDPKTVKKYYNDYWLPLIQNSSRTFLSIEACLGALDSDYDAQNFVRLYSDSQYNGKLLVLSEGYHKLEGTVLENKVSSLKVPLGWRATLYQEELEFLDEESDGIVTHHKRTAPLTITYDTPFVGRHWNDKTKAIIIEKNPNYSYQVPQLNIPVGLFSEKNFTGNHKFVKDGTYDLKDLAPLGGDQLSSIRVPKGYRVLLYSDPKYQGALKILEEGDYAEIPEQTHGKGDFDNIVSSILVQVLSNSSSSTIVLDDERVFLYQDNFYLGNSQGFYPENEPYTATDLETIGSGQMSSIRVPKGWKATLYYEDLEKLKPGQPIEITFDTPYIGDKWNDKVKSVKIEKLKNYSIPKISKNEKVTLFIDGDFKGAQKELEGDVTYYTSLLLEEFSGRISSIKVPAGWRLIGYTEDLFRGDIILLNSNSTDLTTQTPVLSKSTNFNDKIKSLVVQKIGDYVEDNVSERRSIRGKRSIEKEVIFSTETNMIYGPNPTTGYLNLQCSETFMNKVSKIYIASPGGAEKLINFKNNQKLNTKIDLSSKAAGIHFLIVEKLDGSRVVKKVLVP